MSGRGEIHRRVKKAKIRSRRIVAFTVPGVLHRSYSTIDPAHNLAIAGGLGGEFSLLAIHGKSEAAVNHG